jgi:hypothetical protein
MSTWRSSTGREQDAVKRLRIGPISANSDNWMTVVGVVGRVKQYGLEADGRIVIYLPKRSSTRDRCT